jgi:parvulin-like peptidyl-prolyl isomerase
VQRDYGDAFSKSLFAQPAGVWVGPVASAHGLHLVRVKQHHAARSARFEDVRERVTADFTNAAVEKARKDAYERLLARYTVVTAPIEAWTSAVKMPLISTAQAQP